jgi:polysaccharide biosynthesis protein PelD
MTEKFMNFIRTYLFFLVVGGGLILIWAVNLIFFTDNPGFVGVSLHPYLLIVLIAACFLGYSRAMLAVGCVTLVYGICLFFRLMVNAEPASRLFQFSYFSPFVGFLLIGTIGGVIADRHRKNLAAVEKKLGEARQRIDALKGDVAVLKDTNVLFEQKCLTERELLSMLYALSRKMSSLNLKDLQEGILDVLAESVEAQKLAFYMLQGDKLVLCARRGYAASEEPAPPQAILKMTIEEKRALSLKEIAAVGKKVQNPVFISAPVCMGPEGDAAGLVWLEDIPFLRYTPLSLRFVTMVCDWASLSLANIYAFEALKRKNDERHQVVSLTRVCDTLAHKYKGVFSFGASLSEIERDIAQKISPR